MWTYNIFTFSITNFTTKYFDQKKIIVNICSASAEFGKYLFSYARLVVFGLKFKYISFAFTKPTNTHTHTPFL